MNPFKTIGRFLSGGVAPVVVPRQHWTETEVGKLEKKADTAKEQVKLVERAAMAIVTQHTSEHKIRGLNEAADLVVDESRRQYDDFSRIQRGLIREQAGKNVQSEISSYVKRLQEAGKKSK